MHAHTDAAFFRNMRQSLDKKNILNVCLGKSNHANSISMNKYYFPPKRDTHSHTPASEGGEVLEGGTQVVHVYGALAVGEERDGAHHSVLFLLFAEGAEVGEPQVGRLLRSTIISVQNSNMLV